MQLPPARPEENPAPALMTDLFLLLFGTPSMQLPPARPEENPAPALMTDLFLLLFGVDNSTINMVHGIPNQESLALLFSGPRRWSRTKGVPASKGFSQIQLVNRLILSLIHALTATLTNKAQKPRLIRNTPS